MKIATLCRCWPDQITGGMPIQARTLAVGLAERGHEVTAFTAGDPAEFVDNGVKVVHLCGNIWEKHGEYESAVGTLRQSDYDVILSESGAGVPLLRRPKVTPIVFRMHGMSLDYIQTWVSMSVLRDNYGWRINSDKMVSEKYVGAIGDAKNLALADAVVAISDQAYSDMTRRLHLSNVHLIYNAVDTNVFRRWRDPIDKPFRMISSSMLSVAKAVDEAIWIAHLAGCRLVICGGGPDEPRIRELVKELGSDVLFRGVVPNDQMYREYGGADLFIDSSVHHHGLNVTALEALSCGLPIIASDVGGKRSYGETVDFYPMGDIHAAAAIVKRYMSYDRNGDEFRMLADAHRRRAELEFSTSSMCLRFERLFESLIESFKDERGNATGE